MVKKMKWSGIHTQIRIATKSYSLLEGHPLPMSAKFGRRPFPHSSIILFTEWHNDHISSASLGEVKIIIDVIVKYLSFTIKILDIYYF